MQFLTKLKTILPFKILIVVITLLYCFIYLNIEHKYNYDINNSIFIGTIQNIKITNNKIELIVKAKEKLLIKYYANDETIFDYELGDKIEVKGGLELPNVNNNFNLFNYQKYLWSQKINYVVTAKTIKKLEKNKNIFYGLKNTILDQIEAMKNKSYLKSFLLGDSSEINAEVKGSYQTNGISHLFAVSGMHISFISGFLYFLLKKSNKIFKHIIVITFLLLFSFLVNFSPSAMRSFLLMLLILINKSLKLNIKTFNLFIILTCLFLIYNPYYIYNSGFLYSFTISGFLIYYSNKLNSKNYLLSVFRVSLIAFLASFPITLYNSFELNLLSLVLNLLFVPLVTFIVFPLSFLSLIFPILTPIHMFFIDILENASLFFSNMDILKFVFAKPPLIIVFVYYLFVILVLNNKKYVIILILIFIIHINIHKFNKYSVVTMLDVGQGDSILIELRNDKGNILIDTGGKYDNINNYISNNTIIPYLKSVGINHLSYLIITHGDFDHMGEAINLVENFKVEKVIFNCGEFNELENELIKVLDKKKIPYYSCIKELNIDNNKLYFLNNKDYGNENDNSSVIYTELNKHKFLFMGDAGVEVEEDLIEKYNLQNIDVLKVGHHGSKTSSGEEFIESIKPKYSIISVGKNNRYGHPNDSVLGNLNNSKIYRTDQDGSILFKIKKDKLKIETCTP